MITAPPMSKGQALQTFKALTAPTSSEKTWLLNGSYLGYLPNNGARRGPALSGAAGATNNSLSNDAKYTIVFEQVGTGCRLTFVGYYLDAGGTLLELPIPGTLNITAAIEFPITSTPNGPRYEFKTETGATVGVLKPRSVLHMYAENFNCTAAMTANLFVRCEFPSVWKSTATAGAATTLTDTAGGLTNLAKSLGLANLNGCYVTVSSGTGVKQTRAITSHTDTIITVSVGSTDWATNPAAADAYFISLDQPGYVPAFSPWGSGSEGQTYDGSSAVLAGSTPAGTAYGIAPNFICTKAVTPTVLPKAVVSFGDSIPNGAGDANVTTTVGNGFFLRSVRQRIGYAHGCREGFKASGFFSANSTGTVANVLRTEMLKVGRNVLCQLSTNDCSTAVASDSAANRIIAVKASLLAIWQYAASFGCKVYQTTPMPNSASTDGWRTTASQGIPSGASTTCQTLAGIYTWLKDTSANGAVAQSGGVLAGVVDVLATVGVLDPSVTYGSGVEYGMLKWAAAASGTITSGTATSGTTTTLVNSGAPFVAAGVAIGDSVYVSAGTGAGLCRQLSAVTTTTLTWVTAGTAPDATSVYQVFKGPAGGNDNTNNTTTALIHPGTNYHVFAKAAVDNWISAIS